MRIFHLCPKFNPACTYVIYFRISISGDPAIFLFSAFENTNNLHSRTKDSKVDTKYILVSLKKSIIHTSRAFKYRDKTVFYFAQETLTVLKVDNSTVISRES